MTYLADKHLALIDEAERRGQAETGNMRACFELLAVAAAIDRDCAARLAPHKLSEGKVVVLFLLHDRPEGLSPHELAERAGVTRATITGLLDGLERDGFLGRHAGTGDRRKISVRLTAKGRKTARNLFDEHARWIASLFAGITADEKRLLTTVLTRIWRNTDAGTGEDGSSVTVDAPA